MTNAASDMSSYAGLAAMCATPAHSRLIRKVAKVVPLGDPCGTRQSGCHRERGGAISLRVRATEIATLPAGARND